MNVLEQGAAVSNGPRLKVTFQTGLWPHGFCACPEGLRDVYPRGEMEQHFFLMRKQEEQRSKEANGRKD